MFLAPVTLILPWWPSYTNLTGIANRYTDVQIWTSYVKAFESYCLIEIQTDRQITRGHVTNMAVTLFDLLQSKPHATNKPNGSICYGSRVIGDRSLHCGNRLFRGFWLWWPWPWPDDIHIRTWPVLHRDITDVQIWTLYIVIRETDIHSTYLSRQTESTKIKKHATSPVLSNKQETIFTHIITTYKRRLHRLLNWIPNKCNIACI